MQEAELKAAEDKKKAEKAAADKAAAEAEKLAKVCSHGMLMYFAVREIDGKRQCRCGYGCGCGCAPCLSMQCHVIFLHMWLIGKGRERSSRKSCQGMLCHVT